MEIGLMKKLAVIVLGAALASLPHVVGASAALHTVGESTVTFEAVGPAGLKINGASSGVRTVEEAGKVKITAPTTSFHTGIGLRDKHLRQYLESEKHTEAILVVDRSKITLPSSGKADGSVTGALTLHGVTQPAKVSYHITRGATDYRVEGDIEVNILEYQIKKPCYLGVCVGEVVKVRAEFTVQGE
jgi:polyisoprenoid-binding protein YceI